MGIQMLKSDYMGGGMNFCREHSSFPYVRLHLIPHLNTNNKNKIIKKRDLLCC